MANIKITALPANTSVTPGSDVLPLVSAGVTTKATPSQIVNATLLAPGPIGSTTPGSGSFTTLNVVNNLSGAGFSNYLASPPPIGSSSANSGRFTTLTVNGSTTLNVGLNGLLQATSGVISNATAGVNYAPATSGTSILYGNGSGGFSGVTIGSGLTFSSGTLSATGGAGSGTVTSVGLSLPSIFNVTNSPVTTTGTLTGALATQTANYVFAGPTTGSAAVPTFRSLVASDIPALSYAPATTGSSILYANGSGGFSNVTVGSGLSFSAGTLVSTSSGGSVTTVSVVSANGLAGTVANASSTPAITLSTSITGLLKGNGTAISAATAGTDYAAATTGTNAQLLANNGSGGFSNVTVGSGLTLTSGTLAATSGGGGTVTDCSVVSANGFGGSVATSTTTPAITLTTSITGLLKGNGTAVSAAVSGTDYAPATSGNSILYGNGSGGFSNVSIGANMTFSSGVLNANATTSTVGSPGYYGSFYDTNATQVAANTTTAYPIKINSTSEANGVSIQNDGSGNPSLITFAYSGTYNIQYSLQFTSIDSSIHNVNVWLRKNGQTDAFNLADTNSQYAIIGSHGGINGQMIAAVNYVLTVSAGDYLQLMWQTESTNVYIETIPVGTTPVTPQSPGVILTACQVAQIGIGYYGLTSSTSTLIGAGSKTFTTNLSATSTAFTVGTRVRLAYSVTPANYMEGVITSFSGTTLVVNVDDIGGSGTYASWNVSVAGNLASMVYPGAGIPNSTGSAWGTSYTTSGTGTVVALATSPTLVTPILGTPQSGTLTSCTGLPISTGVSGLGTNVATFLATPSSANLASALTDETGSGSAVFNVNPTFTNYTETFYTITYASTFTLSLANGTMQTVTLAGSPTITMPTAVAGKSFTLIINTGTLGSYTVSWSTVAWAGGTTPTVTTTASKKDIFNFYSDGTLWYGSIFGQSF